MFDLFVVFLYNINKLVMTRINSGIQPINLMDNHLIAEIKEINQLCGGYKVSLNSKNGIDINKIPKKFTLNTGHCKHFYNKGLYLYTRFYLLKEEAIKRGFEINCEFNLDVWKYEHLNDWEEDKIHCRNILFERIQLRLKEQKLPIRYYKKEIEYSQAIKILKNEMDFQNII